MKKINIKVVLAVALLLVTLILLPSLAAAQDNVVRITCGNLNVRKGPGTQYSIVKVLSYNTRLYTYGSSGNWLNIGSGQWIYGGYTASSQPVKAVAVTVQTSLNVRSGPGTNYSIIGKLFAGNVTDVLESRNGWCRIDNSRWISEYYTVPLSNKKLGWYYIPNSNHEVPEADSRVNLAKYDAYFVDSPAEKTIYLTFDLGYEMGYTPKILDTLKANDVQATFFVVKSYIDTYPSYIKRMVNEGHTVGNHTKTHPSLPDITSNRKTFYNELLSVAESYKSVTGQDMPKLMRPPMGEYSELSLYLTKLLGYKTIFWSFGYYDWNPEEQPDKVYAFNKITSGTHDGAIMLLHGVSKTNTEILDDLIKNIKEQGYTLAPLE